MHAANNPQRTPCGFTLLRTMLLGTSARMYETKKTRTMTEYWFDVRSKSSSRPPIFALLFKVSEC